MRLFHQLTEEDQHNAIHYCMQSLIQDMLEDGVELEPHSEEDGKMKAVLEKVVAEAKQLPENQQFDFLTNHKEAGSIVFDISVDMARSAYYHPDDDLVIFYESLRNNSQQQGEEKLELTKNNKHTLN